MKTQTRLTCQNSLGGTDAIACQRGFGATRVATKPGELPVQKARKSRTASERAPLRDFDVLMLGRSQCHTGNAYRGDLSAAKRSHSHVHRGSHWWMCAHSGRRTEDQHGISQNV